jgi:hypothetical protein
MSEKISKISVPEKIVVNKIFVIRGLKVMLDRDLAELYGIKAIRLREQTRRNSERFPENFMIQLTESEVNELVSQNAIPSRKHLGGSLPFAFTEHGILMLANVIKNENAIKISIRIIEIFVKMREMIFTYKDVLQKLEDIERLYSDHDQKIVLIFEYIKQIEDDKQQESEQKNRPRIGFKVPKSD